MKISHYFAIKIIELKIVFKEFLYILQICDILEDFISSTKYIKFHEISCQK